jgi:hypothetical protein
MCGGYQWCGIFPEYLEIDEVLDVGSYECHR